tara:strand:+ start:347 stop:556 length:210 start_codon:yes stop_codon:yes gene_type:complete
MYAYGDPQSGAELKRWIKAGREVAVFQPGPFGGGDVDGEVTLEGPHFPAAHKWWVRVLVVDGVVTKVIK